MRQAETEELMDEAGDNEEDETLDGEFELETSEEDGFTEEKPENRDLQSVLNLGERIWSSSL